MAQSQPGDPTAARNVSVPGAGVDRLLTGQIRDKDIRHRATDAFTELVARMYFNIVTAALGNACNTGWGGSLGISVPQPDGHAGCCCWTMYTYHEISPCQ